MSMRAARSAAGMPALADTRDGVTDRDPVRVLVAVGTGAMVEQGPPGRGDDDAERLFWHPQGAGDGA
jgi:hypothetical protein